MIPAILSCAFVIYLYKKLNGEQQDDNDSPNNEMPPGDTALRLAQLTERVEKMATNSAGKVSGK